MTALFYELTGLAMGFILREFLYVPKDVNGSVPAPPPRRRLSLTPSLFLALQFRYGILIMTALSNWGNLPTAIVQSVAANAPFDPTTDPTLGVGFVSVFICVYQTSFFTGVYKVCSCSGEIKGRERSGHNVGTLWSLRRVSLTLNFSLFAFAFLRWSLGITSTPHQKDQGRRSRRSGNDGSCGSTGSVDVEGDGRDGIESRRESRERTIRWRCPSCKRGEGRRTHSIPGRTSSRGRSASDSSSNKTSRSPSWTV